MSEELDARLSAFILQPEVGSDDERDLLAAMLAVLRGDQAGYQGRRDLFGLEKRLERLVGQAPREPVIDRLAKALAPLDIEAHPLMGPRLRETSALPLEEESLDAQVARLLSDPRPQTVDDLDLADAIVAILWRQLRHYKGQAIIWDVERAITAFRARPAVIDANIVARLASQEFLADAMRLGRS